MKRPLKLSLSIIMSLLLFVSCNSKKKLATGGNALKGEVEIKIPCSGPDYSSTLEYFRSNALGESLDQMTSKKKALSNAKAQLAGDIESKLKVVTDNYIKSSEFNNKEELLERFESNARTVINQNLIGIRTICEKLTKTSEGNYKTYIAIELSGESIVASYQETLSKDESLKIDYNHQKFKEIFDAEMDKFNK